MSREPESSSLSRFIALLPWISLQLLALAAAAFRVPLWARHPAPVEQYALELMSAVQIGAAALFFATLVADRSRVMLAILSALPFSILAAILGMHGPAEGLIHGAFVAGWIIALGLWHSVLRRWEMVWLGGILSALWAIGGVVLWYVMDEFGAGSGGKWSFEWMTPMLGAITGGRGPAWWAMGACVGIAAILWAGQKWMQGKASD